MAGTLYIVATPMGNLEDITYRAVRILEQVDLIAAEDTRHSRKLLNHYQITTPLTACHEHNEERRIQDLLDKLTQGRTIALISDAGTPLISDPGYKLVSAVSAQGIPVVPVPGCNAAIAGLSASGLPTDAFLFQGFLPRKSAKQTRALEAVKDQSATLVFYESPRRIKALVSNALGVLGDRKACLARELTKQYEEFVRGSLSTLMDELESRESILGECVLMVQGADDTAPEVSLDDLETRIKKELNSGKKTLAIAKALAKETGLPKNQIYDTILQLKA